MLLRVPLASYARHTLIEHGPYCEKQHRLEILSGFARFWNLRAELRKKRDAWKPIIEAQLLKQQMANFQQSQNVLLKINAQGNALSRIAAAGVVEAAMSDSGERWVILR
jgi:hypothetical protein